MAGSADGDLSIRDMAHGRRTRESEQQIHKWVLKA